MGTAIIDALEARYEAQVAEAHATIKIYLENPVGIGEHPQHIDEVDKQLQKIAEADEKLKALQDLDAAQIEVLKIQERDSRPREDAKRALKDMFPEYAQQIDEDVYGFVKQAKVWIECGYKYV